MQVRIGLTTGSTGMLLSYENYRNIFFQIKKGIKMNQFIQNCNTIQ